MDGCDEKYKRKKSIQLIQPLWTDCTQKGMKRYAKKYYITKIQLGWTNGYAKKKKQKETSSNWDGQICQEILHEKHPIRMEMDMTRNIT